MKGARQETCRPRIGLHTGIAGGLHNALLRAQALGAEAHRLLSTTRQNGPGPWSESFEGAGEETRRVVSETARRLVRRALEKEPGVGKASVSKS